MNEVPQSFWRRRVLTPLIEQMRQGISVEKLALSIALGFVLGIFPIMGATTMLCLIVAILLRLNQPAIHLVNYVVYPLQIFLILSFVRLGERLLGAKPIVFSIPGLLEQFRQDPIRSLAQFGLTGLHGILGWMILAPLLAWAVYRIMISLLRVLSRKQSVSNL